MKMNNMVKKISIFAIVCMMVLMAVPVQAVEAANKSPQIIVKNGSGKAYLPTDLCNLIESGAFGCSEGNNEVTFFTSKTTVTFKNADVVQLYGVDVKKEGKNHVVNFVDSLDPQMMEPDRKFYIKGNKLKFSELKNKCSEDISAIEFTDRYGAYLDIWEDIPAEDGMGGSIWTNMRKLNDNGTDYIYDLYLLYAYNSKSDKFVIDALVPKGSREIKYVKKKETYKYQKITLDKTTEKYDINKYGWEKAKKIDVSKKSAKLQLNAKAKGKITYTELLQSLWYSCPETSKVGQKNIMKQYGKKEAEKIFKSCSVSKKGVISFNKNSSTSCDVLIKANAKGKYATTYRYVSIGCE